MNLAEHAASLKREKQAKNQMNQENGRSRGLESVAKGSEAAEKRRSAAEDRRLAMMLQMENNKVRIKEARAKWDAEAQQRKERGVAGGPSVTYRMNQASHDLSLRALSDRVKVLIPPSLLYPNRIVRLGGGVMVGCAYLALPRVRFPHTGLAFHMAT
jgi:type IV secretory pathway VirJ component